MMYRQDEVITDYDDFQDEMLETTDADFEATARLSYQKPEVKRGRGVFTIVDYVSYDANQRQNKKKAFFKLVDENGGSFIEFFNIDNGICAKLFMMLKTLIGNQLDTHFDPKLLIGTKIEAFITYNFLNNGRIYANIAQWRLYRENPVVMETSATDNVEGE